MWPKRYSIRGLLLLTAFVAVALMWWLQRNNRATITGRVRVQVSGERASIVNTVTGEVAQGGD
ncbi:MAG TPA: hypothetical protein VH107_07775 [Lacipirellulaceae bacterium]|jgi:multidrug resistance efflux pump|nr:hypothetical protein [Lacipirellulaceae bacterium]